MFVGVGEPLLMYVGVAIDVATGEEMVVTLETSVGVLSLVL